MKPTKAKAKLIALMFFIAGAWGIVVSSMFGDMLILFLSFINLGLGGVFIRYYTRAKK